MPNKTKRSKANDSYFKRYDEGSQKEKRILKHLKKHPADKQSKGKL